MRSVPPDWERIRRQSPERKRSFPARFPFSCLISPCPVRAKRSRVSKTRCAAGLSRRRTSALASSDHSMLRTIFACRILHRQAEVSRDFFHGDALASSFFEPRLRTGHRLALLFRDRFVVNGRVGNGPRDAVEHGLKQTDDGRDLTRRQTLDQFMCLLLFAGGIVCHCRYPST